MLSSCAICSKPTVDFNSGVICCNACKLFYRRARITNREMICDNKENCFSGPKINTSCRLCRFQQCLQSGMNPSLSVEDYRLSRKWDSLSPVIIQLSQWDKRRSELADKFHITDNLGFDQFFKEPLKFKERPANIKYTAYDWGSLEQLITIDFLRKFEFINQLGDSDKKIFIKDAFHKFSILRVAMSCYEKGLEYLTFPNGVAIPGLSDIARSIITPAQKKFTDNLFQYCLITYQSSGPSRFSDLLSLFHVIIANMEDRKTFFILMSLYGPFPEKKYLIEDSARFLTDSSDNQ